jgi:hypothetical protein
MLLLVYTYILLLCEALLHLKEKMDASIVVVLITGHIKSSVVFIILATLTGVRRMMPRHFLLSRRAWH